jgi:hypothetical protein
MIPAIYARLNVEPVRRALDQQASRMMLGPAPSPVALACPVIAAPVTQTPECEWPG